MKNILILLLLFNVAYGQIENKIIQYNFLNKLSVGRQGNNDSSAYLQIGPNSGGDKGIGLPRVPNTSAITGTPFKGLMVFDESKDSVGYYDGSKWIYPGGSGSDTVINNIYHGSTDGLRALNNTAVFQANTEDFGKGIFVRDTADHTTPDNWGTTIVCADGGRFKRQYSGQDNFLWYKSTGASDSAAFMKAILNCRQGVDLDSGTYYASWWRLRRDNILIQGIPGKTVIRLDTTIAKTGNCVILFQDSIDKKITGVTLYGITVDGQNYMTGSNSSLLRVGGAWGGDGNDTVTNINMINCTFINGPAGRSSFWMLSDSLRNNNWSVTDCKFLSSQGGHVELRGAFNMNWDKDYFTDWAKADSSAYSCFGGQNSPIRNLIVKNSKFINVKGERFTIEISGTILNSTFDNNYYDGNFRDANGASGQGWFGCKFINETKINGKGGHRSGYELVGGNNTIDNCTITGGAIVIGTLPRSYLTIPSGYGQFLNNTYNITGTTVYNMLGGAIGVGGPDSLTNVNVKNCTFTTGSSFATIAFQRGGARDCTFEGNSVVSLGHYCVRFYDVYWSGSDSTNKNIVFNNNYLSSTLGTSFPVMFINTPVATTFAKWKNIVLINNRYSSNRLYYADSTQSTWTVINNRRISDSTKTFKFDQNAVVSRGAGAPAFTADKGSLYSDITAGDVYKKIYDGDSGWVKMPSTIFDPSRPADYVIVGIGANIDTTRTMRFDRIKRFTGLGNTSSAPLYDIDLVKFDTLAGNSVVISVTNPAKTSTRYSILRLFDGNNKGLVTSYENGQGYIYTSSSEYFYLGTNNAKWFGISPSGAVCIGCAVPTNRITFGKTGSSMAIDFAGSISGKATFKFPDTITDYSFTWPSTSSGATVGQAIKVVGVSGTDIILGIANDNTGSGGGSGSSLKGTID